MSERQEALRRARDTMRRLQHEVRTPISQIIGYADLLEEELGDRGAGELAPDLERIRAAARRLLDLADGKLLEEEPDAGAPPLPEPVAEPGAEPDAPAGAEADPAAAGPRLLVVEADPNDRDLLVRRLERQGFTVVVAADGIEALRRIDAEPFDCVLLELLLPGMNGLEVLERARRRFSRPELPVIVTSILSGSADVAEAIRRGANDHVTKPLDVPVLAARVEAQLETHAQARQVARFARQMEFRSSFIRQALGRDVSDEMLLETTERPGGLDLGAQRRRTLALCADVKGTRARAQELPPADHAAVLSGALQAMQDVVERYRGLVQDVIGDSVVALFGFPLERPDDAERAVACAVALQLAIEDLSERNRRVGLPAVEVGVGVASGDTVLVGFGRDQNLRYEAVGEPPRRAPRIEAHAQGGEVWVDAATLEAAGDGVQSDLEGTLADGTETVRIHRVLGLAGPQLISLRRVPERSRDAG